LRQHRAISITAEHPALRANADDHLAVPDSNRFLFSILATLPAQLVAYHMSVAPILQNRIDPDRPRNLSKTLTVD
jgi:glucosamine 6-phosphate synthetase-like amidotransferase/phosphosugar isomerase protein